MTLYINSINYHIIKNKYKTIILIIFIYINDINIKFVYTSKIIKNQEI